MKLTAKCKCGNEEMRFDTTSEDLGWHCDKCNCFCGLTEAEEALYKTAYEEGKKCYEYQMNNYRELKRIIKSLAWD